MSQGKVAPPGACDTHVHVIGPKDRYPLGSVRTYTPQDAPLSALRRMLSRLGMDRVVLVQPSVYGTDNRCLLDALDELGPRRFESASRQPRLCAHATDGTSNCTYLCRSLCRSHRYCVRSRFPS